MIDDAIPEPWTMLTDAQVLGLQVELNSLIAAQAGISQRIAWINATLIASGERKMRAMREREVPDGS